jgi:polysaccharide export outer membrane protein
MGSRQKAVGGRQKCLIVGTALARGVILSAAKDLAGSMRSFIPRRSFGRLDSLRMTMGVLVVVGVSLIGGCASSSKSSAGAPARAGDASASQPVAEAPPNLGKKNRDLNKWLSEIDVAVPPAIYRIQPPDAIKITAPGVKELDKATARLRSDGKITLNLVGDVYVAGMSPTEVAEELTNRLGKFYNKESLYLSVEVTDFQSKKYYVFGQVNAPGVKPYTGRDTVLKVLAEASLNDDAWPQKVVLIRPNEDTSVRQKVTIDLKQMYTSGKADQNYLLEEGDLVYVPPSPLAEFRITFERLIAPIVPVADFALLATTGL